MRAMVLISSFFGLIIGSFLNVVALRMLKGVSFANSRSQCVECGHQLKFLDLIPVLSYLFLKGKCRYCKSKISPIYPFGELLTAISYGVIVYNYGWSFVSLIHIAFITFMIIASITDLKETIVPNKLIAIGLITVLLLRIIHKDHLSIYLASAVLSFVFLFIIFILSSGKMGGADVKIYALIGLALGFGNSVASLFYASILTLLYHLPLMLKGVWNREKEIPFIPFITIAILITYFVDIYELLPK